MASSQGFQEAVEDEIIRRAAKESQTPSDEQMMISPQEELAKIPTSITQYSPSQPAISRSGIIGRLPNELLSAVCHELDIESCLRLRHVNQWCRAVVSNLPEYRVISTHAQGFLLMLIRSRAAQSFTLLDIYSLMCLRDCTTETCDNLGHFIYLPIGARYCQYCIMKLKRYPESWYCPLRTASPPVWVRAVKRSKAFKVSSDAELDAKLREIHEALHAPPRMVSTPLPFFDPITRQTLKTFRCRGCATHYTGRDKYSHRDLVMVKHYFRSAFLEHFKACHGQETLTMERKFLDRMSKIL
jgi:hypothetical protein